MDRDAKRPTKKSAKPSSLNFWANQRPATEILTNGITWREIHFGFWTNQRTIKISFSLPTLLFLTSHAYSSNSRPSVQNQNPIHKSSTDRGPRTWAPGPKTQRPIWQKSPKIKNPSKGPKNRRLPSKPQNGPRGIVS